MKASILSKLATAAFTSGMVLNNVFIGSAKRAMRDSAVYAVEVLNVRPVRFAETTNTVNVTSGDIIPVEFAAEQVR